MDIEEPRTNFGWFRKCFRSDYEALERDETEHEKGLEGNSRNGFNLLFFSRLRRIGTVLLGKIESDNNLNDYQWANIPILGTMLAKHPVWLITLLIGFNILTEVVIYFVGLIPSQFYKVLGERDTSAFTQLFLYSMMLILCVSLAEAFKIFFAGVIKVSWRGRLCTVLNQGFFARSVLYPALTFQDSPVRDADQRMTQDADRLTDSLSELVMKTAVVPIVIIYYSIRTGTLLGTYGVVIIYLWFAITTAMNKWLISPIVARVYVQERLEGEYRFTHMHVRRNAESVALAECEEREGKLANQQLYDLLSVQQSIVNRELPVNISIKWFDYAGGIFTYVIVGLPLLIGKYEDMNAAEISEFIAKSAFMTMYLINTFSKWVDVSAKFSQSAGYVHRVGEFLEQVEMRFSKHDIVPAHYFSEEEGASGTVLLSSKGSSVLLSPADKDNIVFEDVGVQIPSSGKVVVSSFFMSVERGASTLITGPSGKGKTSLLRAASGLWPLSSGKIQMPIGFNYVQFMSQSPYLTFGTLRTQLIFPYHDSNRSFMNHIAKHRWAQKNYSSSVLGTTGATYALDAVTTEALRRLDLLDHYRSLANSSDDSAILNYDAGQSWESIQSPGQLQLLGFARLFVQCPRYVFLDESSSHIDEEMEAVVYATCRDLGITVISLGHRSSLRQHHSNIVEI
eukprot:Clim_evm39s191 gene=Clim_evmTU39s191